MKRAVIITFCVVALLTGAWIGQALMIVASHHRALVLQIQADSERFGDSRPELAGFSQRYHLMLFRSVGPLLKRPLRQDVRLYYVRSPRCYTSGADAWAVKESDGRWYYKICS